MSHPRVTRRPGDPEHPPPLPAERKNTKPPTAGGEARVWCQGGAAENHQLLPGGGGVAGEAGRGSDWTEHQSRAQTSQLSPEPPRVGCGGTRHARHAPVSQRGTGVHTTFTMSRLLMFMKPSALSRGCGGSPPPFSTTSPPHVLLGYRLPFASCSFSVPTCETEMESVLAA